MSERFAVVLSCWSVEEAHLARIRLAADGIIGHLSDDQTVGMDWALANAMRGVKLLVEDSDAARAREVLESEPDVDRLSEGQASWQREEKGDRHDVNDHIEDNLEANGPDDDDVPRTLEALRSFKRPVIWLMLAPKLIGALIGALSLVSSGFFFILRSLGII